MSDAIIADVGSSCVFFHAHPDDEALLTAGTMARLADEGHRVVLVVATMGERGLADPDLTRGRTLGQARMAELEESARVLGCARIVMLGYADSGMDIPEPEAEAGPDSTATHEDPVQEEREPREDDDTGPIPLVDGPFALADPDEAAKRLADILREENAELLTVYDPNGGYGHPDHVQVHRVGVRAAELADTPVVLEATVDRDLLQRTLKIVSRFYRFPKEFDPAQFAKAYTGAAEITHRVRVGRYADAKRASMAAHATQTTGGDGERTLAALLRIPRPLFRWVMGTEWYVRRGGPAGTRLTHPLDSWPG